MSDLRNRCARAAAALLSGVLLLVAAASAGAQGTTVAFVGVNVIPMDTERVLTRHTVTVQGDRIVAIEPTDDATIPDGAELIDGAGKYLIPGLIDTHAHLLSDGLIADRYTDDELALIVANGVTTIRDPIGRPELLQYRARIAEGELLGPALYVASPQFAGPEYASLPNTRVVADPFDAAAAVREYIDAGYDFIKLTFGITPEVYEGVVLTARGRVPVIGHVGPQVGLRRALEAGQQIEHLDQYLESLSDHGEEGAVGLSGTGVWDPDAWPAIDALDTGRIEDVVRSTVDAEIWNTPTLAFLNSAFGTGRTDQQIDAEPDARFVSAEVRAALLVGRDRFWAEPPAERLRRRYVELRNRIVVELYRAGGKLMAGSDSPEWMLLPGFSLHRELESLVLAGLPPFAALWAATRSPAAFLSTRGAGRTEFARVDATGIRFETASTGEVDFGRIAVGKRADMVMLSANPLDDIRNTRLVDGVMARGRWLPRARLDEILDDVAASLSRAPLVDGS